MSKVNVLLAICFIAVLVALVVIVDCFVGGSNGVPLEPYEKPYEYSQVERPVVKREIVFTDEELEEMASRKPRQGMGMAFYYDELRKRNDAKWAKEELERRKTGVLK